MKKKTVLLLIGAILLFAGCVIGGIALLKKVDPKEDTTKSQSAKQEEIKAVETTGTVESTAAEKASREGDYVKAKEHFEKSLTYYREQKDTENEARILNEIKYLDNLPKPKQPSPESLPVSGER